MAGNSSSCLCCRTARVKCHHSSDNMPCRRCRKFLFQCVYTPPTQFLPPTRRDSTILTATPPEQRYYLPKWTHVYAAPSNSSDRLRAAAIAYIAATHNINPWESARIRARFDKKTAKQEKYLQIAQHFNIISTPLTLSDIKNHVIVCDGSISYPPPHISPPLTVSIVRASVYFVAIFGLIFV
jgi:Fungal Zn(2)-Cys(6) binuclear cluster domain